MCPLFYRRYGKCAGSCKSYVQFDGQSYLFYVLHGKVAHVSAFALSSTYAPMVQYQFQSITVSYSHHGGAKSLRRPAQKCSEPEGVGNFHNGGCRKPEAFRNFREWSAQKVLRARSCRQTHPGGAESLRRPAISGSGVFRKCRQPATVTRFHHGGAESLRRPAIFVRGGALLSWGGCPEQETSANSSHYNLWYDGIQECMNPAHYFYVRHTFFIYFVLCTLLPIVSAPNVHHDFIKVTKIAHCLCMSVSKKCIASFFMSVSKFCITILW